MKTILVSGASGIVGYGTLRSLQGRGYKLIGTTIYNDSIAPAFCDIFELAPFTNDDNYINWLCNIIKKHNVDMIIPGIEADMFKWANMYNEIKKTGVKILLNNLELINLCGDKWLFYNKLKQEKPSLAIESRIDDDFYKIADDYGMPFLLKPRNGYASKGIVKVISKDIFSKHKQDFGSKLMAQPIVGNDEEEYTISAFFDNDSNICCYMSLLRKLSKDGFTEKAQVVNVEEAYDAIIALSKIFHPVGPTNFQFRRHNGILKLLEINPRISSATSIRTAFGYNEAIMSVNYFVNGEIPAQPVIRPGVAIRYIEEHIFYDRNNF